MITLFNIHVSAAKCGSLDHGDGESGDFSNDVPEYQFRAFAKYTDSLSRVCSSDREVGYRRANGEAGRNDVLFRIRATARKNYRSARFRERRPSWEQSDRGEFAESNFNSRAIAEIRFDTRR